VKAILKAFDDSDPLLASGLRIKGEKYFVIRADDKVIQGRKVLSPPLPRSFIYSRHRYSLFLLLLCCFALLGTLVADAWFQGEEGVVCHRTKLAVLVAHYPAGQQAGEVTKVVLALGDYLANLGY